MMWAHFIAANWTLLVVLVIWGLWALLVFGVAWGLGYRLRHEPHGHPPPGHHPEESPIEILKRRYARGEITREQYAQMKQDIES
jgi:putative membrane protein